MAKGKKVTSKDVAKMAGVSQSTVSMILNNYKHVKFSEETRQRVLDACVTLGYQIKGMGYSQNSSDINKLFLVICPSYANMHYIGLIEAIQERSKELGYSAVVANTSRDVSEETKVLQMAKLLPFAGVIFLYQPENPIALQQLSMSKQVIHIYDKNPNLDLDTVELNSFKLGAIIAEHLINLGHECIAYITTSLEPRQIARRKRVEGLQNVFKEKGFDSQKSILICTTETEGIEVEKELNEYETGYHITKKILEREYGVSAIVGMNDMVCFGVMDALLEEKKRIPQDFSVCGCDNTAPTNYRSISLTTVEHFSSQKGKEAVDILVKKIQASNMKLSDIPVSTIRVEYSPKLIARSSTAVNRRKK